VPKITELKILLIDNYDSFTFNIVELLRQTGYDAITMMKNDEIKWEEMNSFSHIILSPGPATPKESGSMLQVIEKYASTKKMLGICLGHQAIAEAFGGTLDCIPNPNHGQRIHINILQESDLFRNIPSQFHVGLYHSWIVNKEKLPRNFVVTSESEDGHIMAIQHHELPVYGVQFHPESYMTEFGIELMKNFLS
jgi:anthranilate synthase component II